MIGAALSFLLTVTPPPADPSGTPATPSASPSPLPSPSPKPSTIVVESDVATRTVWDWLIGVPLQVFLIIVGGAIVATVLRALIKRWTNHIVNGTPLWRRRSVRKIVGSGVGDALASVNPLESARRVQRAKALSSVLRSATSIVVWSIVIITVLSKIGLNIGPLLASAGVAGVALGFGAQSLVKDFISGMFLMAEDQYGVGDRIDVGPASGTVEGVSLRVTKIRDGNGVLWYVRNGEIARVGNMSQGWSKAVVDVKVAYSEDIVRAEKVLTDTANAVSVDPAYASAVLGEPLVTGAEDLSAAAVGLRVSLKTAPNRQWDVARALRIAIKDAFQEHDITMA